MTSLFKRILIAGGTGFVGYWMERTAPRSSITYYMDSKMYNAEEWMDRQWDAIVHLAPVSPARVLEYAQKHGTRVLFASSGAVYGDLPEYSTYAAEKLIWERECIDSGVDCVIARLFTFIGPGLNAKHSSSKFIEAARAGESMRVRGDGSSVRTWMYGEDLGRWMWKLLFDGKGIYNVGAEERHTILNFAHMVASVQPTPIDVLNDGEPATCYVPNLIRAHALGLRETVSLRTAIERTLHESK